MEQKREPITREGYEKLVKEIDRIKHVERPANIKAIEEARSHGDLSENAEYEAAKNEQGLIESRLARCEDLLARAEVIDPGAYDGDDIVFGASVELVDMESDEKLSYRLVGTYEADIKAGSISIESPVGKALVGRRVGDEVKVKTPKGERELAIVSVKY
ncbi:MAG: transcription elongation factor GreA [Bdellovibrionota bacterium]|jgi:transcription elongation factor GreA